MHATTSPKAIDLKPAALALVAAALFAGGIILGSAMDIRIASTPASVVALDTSYNAVEGARAQFGVTPDTSYNAVEDARAQFGVTPATSSKTVESARGQSGVTVDTSPTLKGRSGFPSTRARGITAHDKARGFGGWWASAPVAPVVGTPTSQADPDSRYGAGIR
jgi:hypothetical protein